jgi:CheY-like chemotaxis protein
MGDASDDPDNPAIETVLVVESDVLARLAIAGYLRDCGYRVIEASSGGEATAVLTNSEIAVDIVFSAVAIGGPPDGFALARWIRAERPGVNVILTGTIEKAADEAGDLCEEGPHLRKPYEPQQVVEWIKKLRNLRIGPT